MVEDLSDYSFLWSDGVCEPIEALINRKFDKNWVDNAYGVGTHLNEIEGGIEWCRNQIKVQNKIIKELYQRLMALEKKQ